MKNRHVWSKVKKMKYTDFLIFLIYIGILTGLQWTNGAFKSEFGGHPDEAAHYITGLMFHDYAAALELTSPLKFAENYYIHYPKVAIGHWPPFFYVIQSVWMLLFSPSRISLLLLTAFLTALLAGTVCLIIRKKADAYTAFGAGLMLIILPLIQQYSSMVMAEILLALLSLWAAICFGLFLDTEKSRWSVGFGVCAVLAISTKGNGLALTLLPPLAILFSRKFHILLRMRFWYPVFMVAFICGPWYWVTLDMAKNGMAKESLSLSYTLAAIPCFSSHLVKIAGTGLSILIMLGLIQEVILPCRTVGAEGKSAALGALLAGVWGFHVIVPASLEIRHLIMAVPSLMIFFAAGTRAVAKHLPGRQLTHKSKSALLMLAAMAFFMWNDFTFAEKAWYGFRNIAQHLSSVQKFQNQILVISSDEQGTGMFVSEFAMQEKRPGHVILRADKVLSTSRWDGSQYKLFYETSEEIMRYLERIPAGIVIIDDSASRNSQLPHHQLFRKSIEKEPQRWKLMGRYSLTRKGITYPDAVCVYQMKGHENQRVKAIEVDMSEALGRNFEKYFQ